MSRLIDPVSKKAITPDSYPTLDGYNEFNGTNEFIGEVDFEGPTQFDGNASFNNTTAFSGDIRLPIGSTDNGALGYGGSYLQFVPLSFGQALRLSPHDGTLEGYPVYGLITQNTTNNIAFQSDPRLSEFIYNDSATTITNLTINLPSDFTPGQKFTYFTHGAVTSITMGDVTFIGASITSIPANGIVSWMAVDVSGTLIRIQ